MSLAQASGVHAAAHGWITCRKTPGIRTGKRHSLEGQCFRERPYRVERPEPAEIAIDNYVASLRLLARHWLSLHADHALRA